MIEKFPKPEENSFENDLSTGEALENEGERDARQEQDIARKIKTLETQAEVDPLTGLLNRRGFEVIVHKTYESSPGRDISRDPKSPKVVMVDIDFFKKVNDAYGHAAGDEVIRQVAAHLKDNIRENDTVARIGGEEFVLILNDVPRGSARELAESLRARISELDIKWEGKRIPVTISLGVADDAAGALEEAMKAADEALYAAKKAGRDRVSYSSLKAKAA